MPPEKSNTLKKLLGSLGLHDAAEAMSKTPADPKQHYNSSLSPSIHGTGIEIHPSPNDSVSAAAENVPQDSTEEDNVYHDNTFGSDLRLWESNASAENFATIPAFDDRALEPLDKVPLPELGVDNYDHGTEIQSFVDLGGDSYTKGDCSEGRSSNESLVDELSHRVGTLTVGPDGRTKLHGPSSIFNIEQVQAQGGSDKFATRSRHTDTSKESQDGSAVPEELQEHLIKLYFDWVNPFSDFVDREIYMLAKAQSDVGKDTAYFSRALCNAM